MLLTAVVLGFMGVAIVGCHHPALLAYLWCQRTALRESFDLSDAAPMTVILTWYCRHPFHGIPLDLGDACLAVEPHCAACSQPWPETEVGAH